MVAFSDLITPVSGTDIEDGILSTLEAVGFPVSSWHDGSVPITLIDTFANALADLWIAIVNIAKGAFLSTAADDWLTLVAKDGYGVERDLATYTLGTMVLTDAGGGPHTIAVGQIRVSDPSGAFIFTNTTGGTLSLNGTLSLSFQAEQTGTAYNLPNASVTEMLTTLAGVTVNNPDPGSGTWITTAAIDEQSDESLRTECREQWSLLAMGVAKDTFKAWAKKADPSINRVLVDDGNPLGPGTVQVTLATTAGVPSADVVQTVDDYLRPRKAIGTDTFDVRAAVAQGTTISGTVSVTGANLSAAQAQHATDLGALAALTDIEGTVYLAKLYDVLMDPTGVQNVVLTNPSADVVLGAGRVAQFTLSLTYVAV